MKQQPMKQDIDILSY
jgi:hypothetical protein